MNNRRKLLIAVGAGLLATRSAYPQSAGKYRKSVM